MPNAFYSPNQRNAIQPPAIQSEAVVKSAGQTFGGIHELGAAKAFQDHLDKGYTAMVETIKELPPEVAAGLPSPEAYADSEDHRVAWYSAVNDAIAKHSQLGKSQDPNASPDALRTEAAMAPMGKESASAVEAGIGRLESNQTGKRLQDAAGIFSAPAKAGPAPTPQIDPRSNAGRNLKIALAKTSQHMDTVNAVAKREGIPPSLVLAMLAQESGGNSGAVSETGVKGMMQVTGGTFAEMAKRDNTLSDNNDPKQSITAGAMYLGDMVKMFKGNVPAAIAAYNAGPGPVKAALDKYGEEWVSHLAEFVKPTKTQTVDQKAAEAANHIQKVSKNFEALGGGSFTQPKTEMTQTQFNDAALAGNPNDIIDPRFKEYKAGLKTDAAAASTTNKNALAEAALDVRRGRLKVEQEKFSTGRFSKLYDAMTKEGIPESHSKVMDLNSLIPGGLGAASSAVPESSYLQKKIPAFLKSEEGVQFQSILQQLYNAELKRVSGGAVTDSEFARFQKAYASGVTFNAEQTMDALKAYIRVLKKREMGVKAGYKDVWDDFSADAKYGDPDELPDVGERAGKNPDPVPQNAQPSSGLNPGLQAMIDKVKTDRAGKR